MSIPSSSGTHVRAVLQAERARGFDGLAGTTANVTLPVRQAALDAAIAQVRGWPAALDAIAVEIADANLLVVAATVRVFGFRTPLRLQLRLAPSLTDGLVQLAIDDGSLVASAVAVLGPMLGTLPEGVVLDGRRLTVDVRRMAAHLGVEDLADVLSTATFRSTRGVLWVSLALAAPPVGSVTPPEMPPRSSARASLPVDIASLRAWLDGSHAELDLHLDERLANDLITALHADAQAPSGDAIRDLAMQALRPPVVHFAAGTLRISTTAALDGDPADG